ncbi:MAG: glycosyltransferase family 4 protein, partial [Planctomycetota bacterium]
MKILLTHPFCWPYVRRGAERLLAELSSYLAGRGHEVTVLTSKPGPEETAREGEVRVIRKRQLSHPILRRLRLGPERLFFFTCLRFMSRNRFDVICCIFLYDCCAARITRVFTKVPYIQYVAGIPLAAYFNRRPLDNLAFRFAKNGAAEVIVASNVAQEYLRSDFGRPGLLIPGPSDLERFQLRIGRDLARPRILCSA